MSINLHCELILPNHANEPIPLIQTPSVDTEMILGYLIEVKGAKKSKGTRYVRQMYPWKEQARRYLHWVQRNFSKDIVKYERHKIGQAWKRADEGGGRLDFSGW